jgi:hypothetical protein
MVGTIPSTRNPIPYNVFSAASVKAPTNIPSLNQTLISTLAPKKDI